MEITVQTYNVGTCDVDSPPWFWNFAK